MNILNTGILGTRKDKGVKIPIESGDETSTQTGKVVEDNENETQKTTPVSNETKKSDENQTEKKEDDSQPEEVEQVKENEIPKSRKIVKISKTGAEHIRCSVNNQDFAFSFMNLKAVADGCGSGKHSEVGTRLFGQLFAREVVLFIDCVKRRNPAKLRKYVNIRNISDLEAHIRNKEIPEEAFIGIVNTVIEKMLSICNDTAFVFENYCFTILACLEYEDEFVVYSCGDGFIIKENLEEISFEKLDDGEYPAYYIYNWIDPEKLIGYKEGVEFKVSRYSKKDYINIGVASDGLRFFDDLYEPEQFKFKDNLSVAKSAQIQMLINRNNQKRSVFQDDISICF